jgi:hypothetical protein
MNRLSLPLFPIAFLVVISAVVLAGCGRTETPVAAVPPRLLYTSLEDHFATWPRYLPAGETSTSVTIDRVAPASAMLTLRTADTSKVGANKLFPVRRGRIEFEYNVAESSQGTGQFAVFAIPLSDSGPAGARLIEVGAESADDPRNGFSPLRSRFAVPAAHGLDRQWHGGSLDFDFSRIKAAKQVVIGLRINEGAAKPGAGSIAFRNVRILGN